MFSFIRGTLADKTSEYVVIDNNGIGWQIYVPATVLNKLSTSGESVQLFTYLAVREDAMQLYGFLQAEDLTLFRLLISVSGIGPKAALGILSTLSMGEFALAIMHENIKTLTRVPGVGEKSAKRLIVELKEKVTALSKITPPKHVTDVPMQSDSDTYQDALEALLSLGYNGTEAQMTLQAITDSQEMTTQELIRKALVRLGSR